MTDTVDRNMDSIVVSQGEYALGNTPSRVISTILGSCVSVCLWDSEARLGGMNHILLPSDAGGGLGALGYGASDMERLMNALLKRGADRRRLVAKAFGGAAVVSGLSDIGARNAAFARDFLRAEGIPCVAESLGGTRARQVRFWPYSGRVQHRFVGEAAVRDEIPARSKPANDVEFFG